MKIYHNPRCSKSRQTSKLLDEQGVSFTIIEYLKNPLSVSELRDLCTLLGLRPSALLRTKESLYKELVKERGVPNDEEALVWMSQDPILMERPIIVKDDKAVIGRPPENVLTLL